MDADFGVSFDHEDDCGTGYYHVYARSGPLDDDQVWPEPFYLNIAETKENTEDIMAICDALNRIASRLTR